VGTFTRPNSSLGQSQLLYVLWNCYLPTHCFCHVLFYCNKARLYGVCHRIESFGFTIVGKLE